MENAQLIGLSRQAMLRRQLDVIANNLANINTAGFRAEHMRFSEYLMPGANASAFQSGDQSLSFVKDAGALNDMTQGGIKQTGNPFDVAIDGDGWFVVNTPDGPRYTRNGAFRLDATGNLVTADGKAVQSQEGPITFGAAEHDIAIAADGTISSSEGTKGRLKLVRFEDDKALQRSGESLFEGENPLPIETPHVVQGAIEQSNVRAVQEIADMVSVTRAYTSISKLFSDTSELQSNAINQLGQLKS